MRNLLALIALLLFNISSAQTSNTLYGLARTPGVNGQIHLATMDPSNGTAQNISSNAVATSINLTGASLDPYNNTYHFISNGQLKTLDLTSGALLYSMPVHSTLPNFTFDNFRFNNSDTSLYGLSRNNIYDSITNTYQYNMYLATIEPSSGLISVLSQNSIGSGFALAGSAIDPYQKIYYYSDGSHFIGLDMYDGTIYNQPSISFSNGGQYFDNFTYSCADTCIYGLVRTNYFDTIVNPFDSTLFTLVLDSTTLFLGKIDAQTGVVTRLGNSSIYNGGYALNAGSAIDPDSLVFYFNNGTNLFGVSLLTGALVCNVPMSNTNGTYFDMMRIPSNCYTAHQPIRIPTTTTDINQHSDQFDFSIFPNPIQDILIVKSETKINSIDVIGIDGKLIQTLINTNEINTDQLIGGIYFIKVHTNKGIATKKVIKL